MSGLREGVILRRFVIEFAFEGYPSITSSKFFTFQPLSPQPIYLLTFVSVQMNKLLTTCILPKFIQIIEKKQPVI